MSLDFLKNKAKLYLKQSRWIDAQQILMKMLQIEPKNDTILTKIGQVNEKLNKFDNVEYYFKQAIKINPQNIRALKQLGLLYQDQFNDLSKAETYYIKCININPYDDFILFNLAKLYTKQQKYDKASAAFSGCDYTKAAVNYHFGIYSLAVDQPENALTYFQIAISIRPKVANYHFQYAQLSVKLRANAICSTTEAFLQASQLSEYKEAKILCATSLCFKYLCNENKTAFHYINSALQLKPNDIIYKYLYLKYQQNDLTENDISVRITKSSVELYQELNHTIDKRLDLLVYSYIRNNSNAYIPSDVLLIIHNFFHGNNQQIPWPKVYAPNSNKDAWLLTAFGQQELISMFFEALCPGIDETKVIFTITKLYDYSQQFRFGDLAMCWAYSVYCFMLLQSIGKITNIYNVLSIIEQTEDYFNYKTKLIQLCCIRLRCGDRYNGVLKSLSFLFELFNDNNAFYTIYKSVIKKRRRLVDSLQNEFYWNHSNLKYIRLILMQCLLIFGIGDEDNEIKDSITTIKTLSYITRWDEFPLSIRSCILRLVAWELKCLNKNDLNFELKVALNKMLYSLWDNIDSLLFETDINTSPIDSLASIFEMFKNMNLNLKPYEMEWDNFFGKISWMKSKRKECKKVTKLFDVIRNYCNEMDVNDECYGNWMHCIDLLSVSEFRKLLEQLR